MSHPKRILLPFLLLVALLGGLPASGQAQIVEQKPGDNVAEAVNTTDGSTLIDVAFDIRRIANGVVDNTNAAVAYASCDSCKTVAVAIQIIFASGDVTNASPENVAIAVNENCNACETLASAYQFVIAGGDRLRFTDDGRDALREIRTSIRELSRESLTLTEIQARLKEISAGIREVLRTGLEPAGGDDEDDNDDEERRRDREQRALDEGEGDDATPRTTPTEPVSPTAPVEPAPAPETTPTQPAPQTAPAPAPPDDAPADPAPAGPAPTQPSP